MIYCLISYYDMLQGVCFITSTTHRTIAPTAYPGLPLFTMQAPASKRRYLNEVFLLVLDDLPTWRSMNNYAVDTEAQLKLLAAAEHLAIPATSSGPAFMAVPKLSKTLVSYIVGLMVTTPYFRGSCDERAKGLAEQHVKSCLATLNTMNG